MQNKPLTPLEKLISDKERIRRQCVIQEQKLNDDFSYIQENAGSLLISVLPPYYSRTLNQKQNPPIRQLHPYLPQKQQSHRLLGLSEHSTRTSSVAWDVAKPFCLLGIRKAQSWFTGYCSRKRNSREQWQFMLEGIFFST